MVTEAVGGSANRQKLQKVDSCKGSRLAQMPCPDGKCGGHVVTNGRRVESEVNKEKEIVVMNSDDYHVPSSKGSCLQQINESRQHGPRLFFPSQQ